MIHFVCPNCGRPLQAADEQSGANVPCPCGQRVVVPRATGALTASGRVAAAKPPAPQETAAFPPPADREKPTDTGLETRAEAEVKRSKELTDFLMPPRGPDELGWLGPYRVLRVLGSGGMGVVFQAEDPHLQRPVALKAMKPALAASESCRARFAREARAAAAIKHDHIVTIYQVGEDRDIPFLAMEFLEGEPLDVRLRREGRLPIVAVLRIGREIAQGLAAAHKRGLIHRDIKPGNIWLEQLPGEREGAAPRVRVKILDFGLARAAAEDAQLTQSGVILGTPAYMAPEQARGEKVDARCDLFSLGAVLYQMCTGELPFKGKDTMSVLMALAMDQPPPPRQLRADVPEALSDLIHQLLSKSADGRPATAQAVAEILHDLEEQQRDSSRPRATPAARANLAPTLVTSDRPAEDLWVVPADAVTERVEVARLASPRRRKRSGWKWWLLIPAAPFLLVLTCCGGCFNPMFRSGGNRSDLPVIENVKQEIAKAVKVGMTAQTVAEKPVVWTSLFNGRDLTGWETIGAGKWSAANGILKGDGSGEAVGWLATTRTFADFELELEYRLPTRGNSGIFLRARKGGPTDGRDLIEIQLLDDANHPGFPPETRNGAVFNEAAPKPAPVAPAGQWNKVRVRAEGRRIQVWFNGMQVLQHELKRNELSGLIGLQLFRTNVEFRNVRVRDLAPGQKP
jgi:serine/threonine protein kinase